MTLHLGSYAAGAASYLILVEAILVRSCHNLEAAQPASAVAHPNPASVDFCRALNVNVVLLRRGSVFQVLWKYHPDNFRRLANNWLSYEPGRYIEDSLGVRESIERL